MKYSENLSGKQGLWGSLTLVQDGSNLLNLDPQTIVQWLLSWLLHEQRGRLSVTNLSLEITWLMFRLNPPVITFPLMMIEVLSSNHSQTSTPQREQGLWGSFTSSRWFNPLNQYITKGKMLVVN